MIEPRDIVIASMLVHQIIGNGATPKSIKALRPALMDATDEELATHIALLIAVGCIEPVSIDGGPGYRRKHK